MRAGEDDFLFTSPGPRKDLDKIRQAGPTFKSIEQAAGAVYFRAAAKSDQCREDKPFIHLILVQTLRSWVEERRQFFSSDHPALALNIAPHLQNGVQLLSSICESLACSLCGQERRLWLVYL